MRKILFILLTTLSIAAQGLWLVDANASFNRFADRHNQTVINTYTLTSPLPGGEPLRGAPTGRPDRQPPAY